MRGSLRAEPVNRRIRFQESVEIVHVGEAPPEAQLVRRDGGVVEHLVEYVVESVVDPRVEQVVQDGRRRLGIVGPEVVPQDVVVLGMRARQVGRNLAHHVVGQRRVVAPVPGLGYDCEESLAVSSPRVSLGWSAEKPVGSKFGSPAVFRLLTFS